MITYVTEGNIVDDPAQVIVNTVNCVGVMGKGVALAVKTKYPSIMEDYVDICKRGAISPGGIWDYTAPDGKVILCAATKSHWRYNSQYKWVITCIEKIHVYIMRNSVDSIAIPPLGCGNGGLKWEIVRNLMVEMLSGLDCDIRIYGTPPLVAEANGGV